MKITVVADDLDDSGGEGAAELERDLRRREARERVGYETRVERDGRGLAFHGGVDSSRVVADFGSVCRDHERRFIGGVRSEERRVGEEGRSRWAPYHLKKKKEKAW